MLSGEGGAARGIEVAVIGDLSELGALISLYVLNVSACPRQSSLMRISLTAIMKFRLLWLHDNGTLDSHRLPSAHLLFLHGVMGICPPPGSVSVSEFGCLGISCLSPRHGHESGRIFYLSMASNHCHNLGWTRALDDVLWIRNRRFSHA